MRRRGTRLGNFRGHFGNGATAQLVRPRAYSELVFADHQATLVRGKPVRRRVEFNLGGFRYSFGRVALPLAEGGALPAMVLGFIEFDRVISREFWRRYVEAEDGVKSDALW